MTLWEYMYNGMGAAATVLGFLFVLIGLALGLFLVAYGALLIAGGGKKRRGEARRYGWFGASGGSATHGDAQSVGRHVRKGP